MGFGKLALVGLRGPRGLGWVFGKRLAAQGYRSRLRGYCAQPPRSKSNGKQASPLQAGAWSTRRGFKVGVVVLFGGWFFERETGFKLSCHAVY